MKRHRTWHFIWFALAVGWLPVGCCSARGGVPALMAFTPPPMGWGSWNSFADTVDSNIIVTQAHAMVSTGLRAAGYRVMLMDEGWWLGKRNAKGEIIVDRRQWPALKRGERPGDMRNIVRFLHALGLKAGIYTDAGPFGCGDTGPDIGPRRPNTGSLGHYRQDMLRFVQQGFDYIKVDWCGGYRQHLDPATQYAQIARALERADAKTGRLPFFSICDWGKQSPWTWAPGIGDLPGVMWRTGFDICAPIVDVPAEAGRRVGLQNVLRNFDAGIHPQGQHTGYYNDLDMMIVGMRGMSLADDRVQMSLWAISGAPMILGADLTKLSKPELAILTNRSAVAINQDPMGVQCINVAQPSPGLQVWAKPMPQPGEVAVVLLNRTVHPATIALSWRQIGLRSRAETSVKDVWLGRNLGHHRNGISARVRAHDVRMFIISGTPEHMLNYHPEPRSAKQNSRQLMASVCSGIYSLANTVVFNGIDANRKSTYIEIQYRNISRFPIVARLNVDDRYSTRVQFPPTTKAPGGVGMVPLEVTFNRSGGHNTLRLSSPAMHRVLMPQTVTVFGW
jgi:hypothetical protein